MRDAKKDCELLLSMAMQFAQEMLTKFQGFYPFGCRLSPDGKMAHAAGWTGEEHPNPQEVITMLEDGFRDGAARGDYQATALAYESLVIPPGKQDKLDAIAVHLDHRDNYSVVVYYPYEISPEGELKLGEPFASPGKNAIFGS